MLLSFNDFSKGENIPPPFLWLWEVI